MKKRIIITLGVLLVLLGNLTFASGEECDTSERFNAAEQNCYEDNVKICNAREEEKLSCVNDYSKSDECDLADETVNESNIDCTNTYDKDNVSTCNLYDDDDECGQYGQNNGNKYDNTANANYYENKWTSKIDMHEVLITSNNGNVKVNGKIVNEKIAKSDCKAGNKDNGTIKDKNDKEASVNNKNVNDKNIICNDKNDKETNINIKNVNESNITCNGKNVKDVNIKETKNENLNVRSEETKVEVTNKKETSNKAICGEEINREEENKEVGRIVPKNVTNLPITGDEYNTYLMIIGVIVLVMGVSALVYTYKLNDNE